MDEEANVGQATSANPNTAYVPPKSWEKLSDSEKIERMREIIHSLTSQIYSNRDKTEKNRTDLLNHRHDIHGEVLQKMPLYENLGGVAKSNNPTSNYF